MAINSRIGFGNNSFKRSRKLISDLCFLIIPLTVIIIAAINNREIPIHGCFMLLTFHTKDESIGHGHDDTCICCVVVSCS